MKFNEWYDNHWIHHVKQNACVEGKVGLLVKLQIGGMVGIGLALIGVILNLAL